MAYSTIPKGSLYMNTKLYTGNGNAGNAQTGVGFQPDLVWLKSRTNTEYHNFYDSVRGVTKRLSIPPAGAAQSTISGLTAFGTDGFTLGAADTANQNSQNFVAWNWKETATAGFDIVSYTGNGNAGKTVAHNLNAVPKMIIVKRYNDGTASWMVYHNKLGTTNPSDKYLSLDATAAQDNGGWNSTMPTSSVFTVSADQRVNASGASYIAYVFAEKQGYSKFGSYTGNGNADGTFIYTGFKPSFVMTKDATSVSNWLIIDNKRNNTTNTGNLIAATLKPNLDSSQGGNNEVDFLSNGFKWRGTDSDSNKNNAGFIYMAFAENPFVATSGTTAVPVTAR